MFLINKVSIRNATSFLSPSLQLEICLSLNLVQQTMRAFIHG